MATPEAEETVAAPPSSESAVADVVKSAEGEKEAPKTEEPIKAEEPPASTEETTTETPAEAPVETPEETPAEPTVESTPAEPFKEESNLVADLKESEKKALEDFKARIVKGISDNEFKVPKKVAPAPKEPEVAETPKEAEAAPATETSTDAPAAETPAAEAPAAETKAEETPVTETPETESKASEEVPPKESPLVETPAAAEEPAVESSKNVVEAEKEAPPAEPTAEAPEPVSEPAAATTEESPAVAAETPAAKTEEAPAPVVEDETKEAAPVEEPAAAVEEEEEDLTPADDVALWGVPLLHTKGDARTDVILLKFLRARDFNVSSAFEQLKKTIIWRKTYKTDTLLDEDFGTELDKVAFNYGKDKEGHPVCYNVYSPFQNKELYAKSFGDSSKLANFIRWRIQVLEKGIKLLNFSPEGPNAMVQITDLKKFPGPLGNKEVWSAYNQAVNLLQDNYPELVVKKVFINVPWYFSAISAFYAFVTMSPFISARTKSKFVVYTPARTTEGLLKFISAEYVPITYGGLSRPGDSDFEGVDAPATEQVIKAGEKAKIEIPVTESGGTVTWDLTVVGYDVSYGAEYVPSGEGSYTTIIEKPKKLQSTTEEPVRTSFKITEPGKILLSIDNATRKKKTAIYRYIITSPTVEPETAG